MTLTFPSGPTNEARRSDFNAIVDAIAGNGVHNGMTITAGPSGLQVTIAAGSYTANGTKVQYGGATPAVTLDTADASLGRIDIIVADYLGAISVVKGMPSADLPYPDIPSGKIRLAIINVTAGLTTLAAGQIYEGAVTVLKSKGSATLSSGSSVVVSDRAVKTNSKVYINARNSAGWSVSHSHTLNIPAGGTYSFTFAENGSIAKSGGTVTGITGVNNAIPDSQYFWVDTIVDGTSFKINSKSAVGASTVFDYIIEG